jgi:hypothetical protein
MYNTSENLNSPSAPPRLGEDYAKYPGLFTESTNFRIKKIMDDQKFLEDEIKARNAVCKKYGRMCTVADFIEYSLIATHIVVGVVANAVPVVGAVVSTTSFSGVGLISGVAKMIQGKLQEKKMSHYKRSVVACTTLNNLNHKMSKAIADGQITHEEFEDIQKVVEEWKRGNSPSSQIKAVPILTVETMELVTKQATEKAQKDILDQLKNITVKKV